MNQDAHIDELITDPSPAAQSLVAIILSLSKTYEDLVTSKSLLKIFLREYKFLMYKKEGYKELYTSLTNFSPDVSSQDEKVKIRNLLRQFRELYEALTLNNFVLAYEYNKTQSIKITIQTQEELKILALQKVHGEKMTVEEFLNQFGHYSPNPYEVSERRFWEYSIDEILQMASLGSLVTVHEKQSLESAMNEKNADMISLLIALREFAKNKIFLVIDHIRRTLLTYQTTHPDQNVFDQSLEAFMGSEH